MGSYIGNEPDYAMRALYVVGGCSLFLIVFTGSIWWLHNNRYNSTFRNNFINGCVNDVVTRQTCACALDLMEDNYSYKEAKQFDKGGYMPNSLKEQVERECV